MKLIAELTLDATLATEHKISKLAASKFLYDNGYELDIDPESENLELRHMLSEIKKQTQTLNQDIMKQLSFYVSRRIKKL